MAESSDVHNSIVLLLKSKNSDDEYEKALTEAGYQPVFIPILSFQFTNKQEVMESLRNPEKYSALICTSQRAVEAVYRCTVEFQEEWRASFYEKWLKIPVFVTGKATGKHVREKLHINEVLGEESGNAEALASIILSTLPRDSTKALLFPCANIKKETLSKKLDKEGYSLHCVTAYCTTADPNFNENLQAVFSLEKSKGPACVVFFSPSGVAFSQEVLKKTICSFLMVKLIAIGQSTAEGMREYGLLVAGVVEKPNPTSLIKTVGLCLNGKG